MYRNEKRMLLSLCDTMQEAHQEIFNSESTNEVKDLCSSCQEAAIRIGESLENEGEGLYSEEVNRLEQYCEAVYSLSERNDINEDDIFGLDKIVENVIDSIICIHTRLKVAFFPYKADMWDSLESFYLAAKEDPETEAYLVPIPYFEFDQEKNTWESRYDFERFPVSEDPVPFDRFNHRDGSVDIAYVHNPYDNRNYVTSIHPDYYSSELKKHVAKLVYAPYFVTAGYMADGMLNLPVYENMDYAVFQSENTKKCCEGTYYYDKILPFGSSKFDMIIRKSRMEMKLPDGWEDVIRGRKTLMLNSSINDLLGWNMAALEKLEYVFGMFEKDGRIALIWRPHPLYEATLRSMRPELVEKYECLKKRFAESGIGVFDTTPDISDTVAIADGYIGSGASSVINLFGAAGKPAFLFNNMIRQPVSEDERRVLYLSGIAYFRGRLYMRPYHINAIFSVSAGNPDEELRYEGSIPDVENWTCSLTGLVEAKGKLYMSPFFAKDAMRYDPVLKSVEMLGCQGRMYDVRFVGISASWPSKKSIFLIPDRRYLLMEYVIGKGEWIYHQVALAKLHEGIELPSYVGMIYGSASYDDNIYCSIGVCNRILRIEAGTGKYKVIYLGQPELTDKFRIVLKGASREGLWLCMGGNSDIFMAPWDSLADIDAWKVWRMKEEFSFTHDDMGDPYGVHGGMIDHGKDMVILPFRSPHMIRIDKSTGKMAYIAEEFFKESDAEGIAFNIDKVGICGTACFIGSDSIAVQRSRDMHVGIIDMRDGSYREFVPKIPSDLFGSIVSEDAGFYKGDTYDEYKMNESRLFPLEHFLDVFARDGYANVRDSQILALSTLAANLDGTCGVKTHEFLKQKIVEDDA